MLRILIADDHEIIRKAITMILLDGYPTAQVEEAEDAGVLIDKARSGKWDIILSDLAMPGGGGLHALEQINLHTPQTPVLIVSMYPEEQYGWRVMKAGASGYLNKDAVTDELIKAVQTVLGGGKYTSAKTKMNN